MGISHLDAGGTGWYKWTSCTSAPQWASRTCIQHVLPVHAQEVLAAGACDGNENVATYEPIVGLEMH